MKLPYSSSQDAHTAPSYRFSIAPMMNYTDRHFRYFLRMITQHTQLYTEMITTQALLEGKRTDFLNYSHCEHPIALQLGGDSPKDLAKAALLAQKWGYDEVNLNVGCPSNRVQQGNIGACLMAQPKRVFQCLEAMIKSVDIRVTIKHRLGIQSQKFGNYTQYDQLRKFIDIVSKSGCHHFIVHARIAILEGLNPTENRQKPAIDHHMVYKLKQDYPEFSFILNGEIKSINEAKKHLRTLNGVMIGREAYRNPFFLSKVDQEIFLDPSKKALSRFDILLKMIPYLKDHFNNNKRLHSITRHMLKLFQGQPGARYFRKTLGQLDAHPQDFLIQYHDIIHTLQTTQKQDSIL